MSLIKTAVASANSAMAAARNDSASVFNAANHQEARKSLKSGFFDARGEMAQHHLDSYHASLNKARASHAELQGLSDVERKTRGAALVNEINGHRADAKKFHGLVNAHIGGASNATNAVEHQLNPVAARINDISQIAQRAATDQAAHVGSGAPAAAGGLSGMLDKAKGFVSANPGKALAIGGGLAAGGYLAHKLMGNKQNSVQYPQYQ